MFLELAVHGEAAVIVTGDEDLLSLHPLRAIDILGAAAYLEPCSREGVAICAAHMMGSLVPIFSYPLPSCRAAASAVSSGRRRP